jgi:hypothetical protein
MAKPRRDSLVLWVGAALVASVVVGYGWIRGAMKRGQRRRSPDGRGSDQQNNTSVDHPEREGKTAAAATPSVWN